MLHLLAPTPASWTEAALADVPALLTDHAHCELKAAQNALALVGRFGPDLPDMIAPLTALAREETSHFREVHARLNARGRAMTKPEPDGYVNALQARAREDHREVPVLLDKLLVAALIEARSCERFQLLADALEGHGDATCEDLGRFYRGLMVAEARHFSLFRGLATEAFGTTAKRRLATLAEREAEVAGGLPLGPTVHG